MMRKTSILAALAVAASSMAASAEQKVVIFLGKAFFPSVTYVQPGDTIVFENKSTITTQIASETELWSVGPIPMSASESVVVTPGMEEIFYATEVTGNDADEVDPDNVFDDMNAITVEGAISFDAPPS